MEKNGRNSCTGNSSHVAIRYFFVADRVKEKVDIRYCQTEIMLPNTFTKPLHWSLFRNFSDIIMGYNPISIVTVPRVNRERVGE